MNRRVTIISAVLFVLVVVTLFATTIPRTRLKANRARSENNLREVALFAAHHFKPDTKRDSSKLPREIPAATVVLSDVPPDLRLSWVVDVLPGMDQTKQPTTELIAQIDRTKPWLAEPNQRAATKRLPVLLCPENPPEVPPNQAAVTSYVGIGGLGPDAATLPAGSPRAGAFRYDAPTPFTAISDGLSQTLLFAETRNAVGPWLRGGFATTRGLNDSTDAPPLVGGQFGGYFPEGANFALCDGSVRLFTPSTSPQILLSLATIAGKESDPVPRD